MATESWQTKAGRWATRLFNVISPPRCVHCQQVNASLCEKCIQSIAWMEEPLCAGCGLPVYVPGRCLRCRRRPLAVTHIRSAVYFDGPARSAIHAIKYAGQFALARDLAAIMAVRWQPPQQPFDLVLPIPLHAKRLRERGYNQSELLVQQLCERFGWSTHPEALWRDRHTRPQVGLSGEERIANVSGAFVAVPALVSGRSVLLVDDVCTTGATLDAAAQALLTAGATRVAGFCVARALDSAHHTYG